MSTHPQQIGKYPIERVIGSGAMGVVYLASHPIMEIPVAIKTMTNIALEKPQLRKRFFQEAKAAGKLQHENIVRIYDADTEDDIPFIVMEYLDGTDLAALLEDEDDPMPMQSRLEIAYQVSRALEHAHEHDVIHRDIKPSNVCILPDHRVKLVDFGIAKLDTSNLRTQGPLGTPEYMSPEQVRGETADARSDLFSLGVMLYELLTDRRPFSARSVHGTWTKILGEDPPPMGEMVNGEPVPDSLRDLVDRCLEKDVTRRPTAREAAKRLREVLKSMPDPYSFEALDDEQIREKLAHAGELLDLGKHRKAEVVLRRLTGARDTYAEEIDALRERIPGVAEASEAVERGRKALRQLDFESAQRAAREALERAPRFQTAVLLNEQAERARDINAGLDRAREALEAKDFEVAVQAARDVLEVDDSHVLAARLLEQAEVGLERRRRLAERLAEAERARDAGQLQKAADLAHSVLKEDESSQRARQLADEVEATMQERQEMRARVERFIQEGSTLATGGEHEEALRRVQEALALDPGNGMALELKARIEDRMAAAVEEARKAAHEAAREAARESAEAEAARQAAAEAAGAEAARARSAAEATVVQRASEAAETPAGPGGEPGDRAAGDDTQEKGVDPAIFEETVMMKGRQPAAPPPTVVEPDEPEVGEPAETGAPAVEEPADETPEVVADPPPPVPVHQRALEWATTSTRGRMAASVVAALLVLLVGYAFLGGDSPGAGDAGLLAVDATPWARVVGIVDADGRQVEVGDDAVTPVSFELAPGSYSVTLLGPDGQETRTLEATVDAAGAGRVLAEFQRIDVDAYFEESGWRAGR